MPSILLITVGEPAGIGPDCILRAYHHHPHDFEHCLIVAPASWLRQRAEQIQPNLCNPIVCEFSSLQEACIALKDAASNTLYCWNPLASQQKNHTVTAGQPSAQTAPAVVACIEAAANACLTDQASALVTGPIEKAILRNCGFDFPGHTEFLDHLAMQHTHQASRFVMMLASDDMRVALLTTHIALRDVPSALSSKETLQCLRIVAHDLRYRFAIEKPRLALCGLNPHAGEQGHFGREEIDVLAPAVAQAQAEGIDVTSPLPADSIFSTAMRKRYDAIICCYHDQALIPLKALSFGEAVNITLGLPFIRTSVDHGTALDRVGSNDVSYTSLLAAMRMARQMCDASK
ncbi:MAG: 4-hydroxythreonine-4-phosphate dehydrogenase PdxA [Mariprofundus sp.]|nr:4-hydroxythreonine-4-phosphate dehydrogenase PdxA [Mariprofundus sp.]